MKKNIRLKSAAIFALAAILLLAVISTGFLGYKYLKLREAYKVATETLRQNSAADSVTNVPDSTVNPFVTRVSAPTLSFNGNIISITPSGQSKKTVEIKLDTNTKIESVSINNSGNTLAVVTVSTHPDYATEISKLSIIRVSDGVVEKSFKTGDSYGVEGRLGYVYNPIFSNDDSTLYFGYSVGASTGATLAINLKTFKVSSECLGSLTGILPAKSQIKDAIYQNYANALLVSSKHYYAIGGSTYMIDIIDPKTCKILLPGILEDSEHINTDLQTFYDFDIRQ